MEAVALGEAIKRCIVIGSTLLVEEGSRLYRLRQDIEWIEAEMRRIQSFLSFADKRPSGNPVEMSLRKDIRDLAYDVEDIVDTYFPYIASSHRRNKGFFGRLKRATCYLCHCYTHHCLSMEIEGIKRRIDNINRAKTTYGNLGSSSSEGIGQAEASDPRPVFLHADEPNVVIGFEKDIQKLEAKLLSNNENSHDVVSIVGMPGLGKTTLAKKVFNSVKSHFGCSALVYVSQEPNTKEIFRNIAMQVGMGKETFEENVEANLIQFLRRKRYVILFDDVWTTETWDHLKMIIPNNSENGGVAILTSRSSMVGRYAGGESSLHELAPLNPENSWDLFTKLVMSGAPSHTNNEAELEDIGRKVVEKCGGVPLAIVVTVGLLRSKERTELEWKGVLDRMGQDQEDVCSKLLVLSYNDLPLSMKPCFLYFGLLPEDEEISALELINFWVAEKFIKVTRKRTLEEVGEDYLKDLVSRNLIQVVRRRYDGSISTCRIHDLLHALCITLAEEGNSNFFETSSNLLRPNILTSVRRVTTHRSCLNEYLSLDHQTPKLRAFVSFYKCGEVDVRKLMTFLGQFRFLRVLVIYLGSNSASPAWSGRKTYNTIRLSCFRMLYSGDDVDDLIHTTYLPSEIGNLIHLSCLKLEISDCKLMFPPTMSNLKNLMTLDVQKCDEVCLPISIWKMKELRHIYFCVGVQFYIQLLKGCRLKDTKSIPVDLPNLQTLFTGHGMVPKELFKLNSLRTLICCLYSDEAIEVLSNAVPMSNKLQELVVAWRGRNSCDSSSIKFDLSRYHNLCTLKLMNKIEKLPTFPPNLTKLTLRGTFLEEDPMETLGKLPKLKILKLGYAYSRKRLVCSGAGSFPQLHKLKLVDLPDLEELIVGEGGMPRLNKFVVRYCYNLVQVSQTLLANVATVIYDRDDVTQLAGGWWMLPRWVKTVTRNYH